MPITKIVLGRVYNLTHSTEERVGTVLYAIHGLDMRAKARRRKRFKVKDVPVTPLGKFEYNLAKEIKMFKEKRKVLA